MARMFVSELSSCECHSTRDNEAILLFNLQIPRRCRGSPSHPQASHGVAVCCGGMPWKSCHFAKHLKMRKHSSFPVSHPAISDAILHSSKHGAQSLRAAEKKSLVKHKFLWWKCVLTKTLVSPRCLIKILSFFRSRRRQAATFLHGAERVAQMTQKALQLALNVSNEAWEDATVDNLVTYLDNYT